MQASTHLLTWKKMALIITGYVGLFAGVLPLLHTLDPNAWQTLGLSSIHASYVMFLMAGIFYVLSTCTQEWRIYWRMMLASLLLYLCVFTTSLLPPFLPNQLVVVNNLRMLFWLFTNFTFLVASASLFISKKTKFNFWQLLFDSLFTLIVMSIITASLFNHNATFFTTFSLDHFICLSLLIIDSFIIVILTTLTRLVTFYQHDRLLQRIAVLQSVAFLLFCSANAITHFHYLSALNFPTFYADFLLLCGFSLTILVGVISVQFTDHFELVFSKHLVAKKAFPINVSPNNNWIFYALAFIAVILTNVNVFVVLIISLLSLLHYFMSKYFMLYLQNEQLLARYSRENTSLVATVSKQKKTMKQLHDQFAQLEYYDYLTTLPNERYLYEQLQAKITAQTPFTLLLIDIDRFKDLNERYGHDTGDLFLQQLTPLIQRMLPTDALLTRQNGDEFSIVISHAKLEPTHLAKRLLDVAKAPLTIGDCTIDYSFSIGIATYPQDATTHTALLKLADQALRVLKKTTKQSFFLASDLHLNQDAQKIQLEQALVTAIERRSFELYYQPQFEIKTKRLIGCEALIRWQHPELGFISPQEFITLAEESDLIYPIGSWVLDEAIRQICQWHTVYKSYFRMGINISPRQLQTPQLIEQLEKALAYYELDPRYLNLEITESMAVSQKDMIAVLEQLHALGVFLSIDDFGTGYGSLSYFKNFPIQTVKLAREFIIDITTNQTNKEIIAAIINMSKTLKIETICEGIETQAQLDLLAELDCEQAQGYLLGRPVPAPEFERLYLEQFR